MSQVDYSSVTPEQFISLHLFERSKVNSWRSKNGHEKYDYQKIKNEIEPKLEKLVDSQVERTSRLFAYNDIGEGQENGNGLG